VTYRTNLRAKLRLMFIAAVLIILLKMLAPPLLRAADLISVMKANEAEKDRLLSERLTEAAKTIRKYSTDFDRKYNVTEPSQPQTILVHKEMLELAQFVDFVYKGHSYVVYAANIMHAPHCTCQ
jgi:hypothetical protein